MTDLSTLSDDQLKALYAAPQAAPDLGKMSDAELMAAYNSHPSVLADVAKSGGIGLAKGAIGLAGMPGDLGSLISSGYDKATNALGINPDTAQTVKSVVGHLAPAVPFLGAVAQGPTSHDIQSTIEGATGPLYKPQTVPGEYAQTIGEFAPAVFGGPESLAAKVGTRVLAPAIASETAGQATKGTAAEPYARVAGAVAGGGLASMVGRASDLGAPTVDALKDAARANYQHPDVLAVKIKPQAVVDLRDSIKADLEGGQNSGFRKLNEPKTFAAVDELINPNQSSAIAAGGPITINDIDSVRKVLGRISKEKTATGEATSEAAASQRAISHINDFLPNLKQPDLIAGDAAAASQQLNEARGNWAAAKRAQDAETKLGNADIQASSTYAGGNINNATRQAFRPMLKNDAAKAVGYNPEELDALNSLVRGSTLGNVARGIGKLSPSGGLGGHLNLAAAYATGGSSIPASLIALASKKLGEYSTKSNADALIDLLKSRSPLHQQAVQQQQLLMSGQAPRLSPQTSAMINALMASRTSSP